MVHRRTAVAAVVAIVMVVVPTATASAGQKPADAGQGGTIAETLLGLVKEAWAEDPALVALRARDKGYTLNQALDAVGDENLAVDGTITEDGAPVTPDGTPSGVLEREGDAEVVDALDANQKRLARSKRIDPPEQYLDDGAFILVLLLALMAEGYTVDQIVVDGLLAGGISSPSPFSPVVIVDEKGKVVEPGEGAGEESEAESETDVIIDGVIRDMVALVEGANPLDPEFKSRFTVTYEATIVGSGGAVDVTGKGKLGPGAGGEVYLGKVRATMVSPAAECPEERVTIDIGLSGPASGRRTELDQTWGYVSSTTGSGGSSGDDGFVFCITAAEAPELVGFLPGLLGPLYGPIADGAKLETRASGGSTATLTLREKR